MEQACFRGAERDALHLRDLGEGEAFDEEQLGGEPLVHRQRGEGVADRYGIIGGGLVRRLSRELANVRTRALCGADVIGAAPAQDAESPWGEAGRIAQPPDAAQDRDPAFLYGGGRSFCVPQQALGGACETRMPAARQLDRKSVV